MVSLTGERVRRYTGKLSVLHQNYSTKVGLYVNIDSLIANKFVVSLS